MDQMPIVLGIAKWEFSIPSAKIIESSSCKVTGIHPTALLGPQLMQWTAPIQRHRDVPEL
jgi:hypothetical protein